MTEHPPPQSLTSAEMSDLLLGGIDAADPSDFAVKWIGDHVHTTADAAVFMHSSALLIARLSGLDKIAGIGVDVGFTVMHVSDPDAVPPWEVRMVGQMTSCAAIGDNDTLAAVVLSVLAADQQHPEASSDVITLLMQLLFQAGRAARQRNAAQQ